MLRTEFVCGARTHCIKIRLRESLDGQKTCILSQVILTHILRVNYTVEKRYPGKPDLNVL